MSVIEAKTSKTRTFTIPKNIYELLEAFFEHFDIDITRQTVHRHIKQIGEGLGISNLGAHSMRKTYAYQKLRETQLLEEVQKALNHRHISTTVSYLEEPLKVLFSGMDPASREIREIMGWENK